MRKEYDFSKSRKNPHTRLPKKQEVAEVIKKRAIWFVLSGLVVISGMAAAIVYALWPSLPRTSRSIMFVSTNEDFFAPGLIIPTYRIEVTANGRPFGSVRRKWRPLSGIQNNRIVFELQGETRFVFSFIADDGTVFCRSDFTANIRAGDMLSFSWYPAEKIPASRADWLRPMFGPGPNSHAPPLAYKDKFKGVWCWFGPANAEKEHFRLTLWTDRCSVDTFKSKARAAGLKVKVEDRYKYVYKTGPQGDYMDRELAPFKFIYVTCPEGRLVDAILEVESWSGVTEVITLAARIY